MAPNFGFGVQSTGDQLDELLRSLGQAGDVKGGSFAQPVNNNAQLLGGIAGGAAGGLGADPALAAAPAPAQTQAKTLTDADFDPTTSSLGSLLGGAGAVASNPDLMRGAPQPLEGSKLPPSLLGQLRDIPAPGAPSPALAQAPLGPTMNGMPTSAPQQSDFGKTIDFLRGQNQQQGLDLFAQPIPAGDPGGPSPMGGAGAGGFNPEAIARRAGDIADSSFYMNQGAQGNQAAASGANQLQQNFLGLMQGQMKNQGGLDVAKEQSRGHIQAAEIASRSNQLAELDKTEAHVRDAVGKGAVDKLTGQAQIDFINARRQALASSSQSPGGAPGRTPAGVAPPGAGGASSVLSPAITAGGDIAGLRSLFGTVDPGSGRFTPKEGIGGADINALIDKIDPKQIPQVAAAIRSGTFGDPGALRNAGYNSLAQNYLMSQGRLPGGPGQVPGNYAIPVGEGKNQQILMNLLASPASNMADSVAKKAAMASSGVPYDTIALPNGTKIPFDRSGVQGLSNMSATLGYNQGKLQPTAGRLSPLAQLLQELGK